jgi:putative oxidoreductase
MIHFLKDIMIAGGLMQIAHFGAGQYSLDARRARNQVGPVGQTS